MMNKVACDCGCSCCRHCEMCGEIVEKSGKKKIVVATGLTAAGALSAYLVAKKLGLCEE